MRKYMKIVRYGKGSINMIKAGEKITVTEKLDGANASFKRDGDQILCFSRNKQLDEKDTLRGFYNWVYENIVAEDLVEGAVYYGEWLVRHKLDYGENENQFYLFDIYDEELERYCLFKTVEQEAERLNINLVPLLYSGMFQSHEHLESFVGQSKLGEVGEGVVVKNTWATNKHGEQQFFKIVSASFKEMNGVIPKKQKEAPQRLGSDFVEKFLTTGRVEKMLHKLVDEGLLEEDYDVTNMGIILKNMGSRMFDDIMEEEADTLFTDIKQGIGRKLPSLVKEVLVENNKM